ncbi:NAD(P)-binding domain-containing protein [Asanoa sp. WMMD1127]|uniref:NADPH-dependent F420 reductase n=1 Tax=Asanoa sp. WMMD1127 TaxID=3016107 RepID=UPI00241683B2|nr:NAD(P)-binding domain-containing protein [Asanoa sp. WMMD1127]MDG4824825.1 NAD(P)-binding domain-containing protein [Asanoa sp. WMMD1127]
MDIGIIGAGLIGGTLARRLGALGHRVVVANSRGPHTLDELAAEPGVSVGTVAQAADHDLVVISIPTRAVPDLPGDAFAGKVVVDTNNYYPQRDGQIAAIDGGTASSRWAADHLTGARVVKAFNTINWKPLGAAGQPAGTPGRIALPLAGDDANAKQVVAELIDQLGFDPVDTGSLDESWRQEPGTPVYGANRDADGAREALAAAVR